MIQRHQHHTKQFLRYAKQHISFSTISEEQQAILCFSRFHCEPQRRFGKRRYDRITHAYERDSMRHEEVQT